MLTFDIWVAAGLTLSAGVALLAPLALGWWWHRRSGASLKAFGWGALTFVLWQGVVRMPWQVPLGLWLKPRLEDPVWLWGWVLVSSLTAGLFEETGRAAAYRWWWKDRSSAGGVMLGLGHGGIESILLVGLSLVSTLVTYLAFSNGVTFGLPPDKLALATTALASLTPLTAVLGGAERLFALSLHVACSLLVLGAVRAGDWRWWVASVGLHTLVNLVGVALSKAAGPLATEGALLCFAVACLAITRWRLRAPAPPAS